MAFTRNPSDTDVSPATYTADGASDLILVDQQRDIAIDGSDEDDSIIVSADALAADALYNYDVRGFEGDDTINISAALIQDSTFNGNIGDDTIDVEDAILTGSYVLGGKDNDDIDVDGVTGGEVNGNLGDDDIDIFSNDNVNASIRGGQGNDIIDIFGDLTNSGIYGDKGADIINVLGGDHSGSAVYGGEDNDVITNEFGDNIQLWGNKGNDVIFDINAFGEKGVTIDGGEGNDEIETISLLGATSTIDAGVGADEVAMISELNVFGSEGIETYVFESGDSVAATKTSIAGDRLAVGDTIEFGKGVDLLFGLGGEDFIDIDFNPSTVDTIGPVAEIDPATGLPVIDINTGLPVVAVEGDSRFKPLTPGAIYEVYGTYDLGQGIFTVEAEVDGSDQDHLYIVGAANDTVQNVFNASTNMFISNEDLDINQFI